MDLAMVGPQILRLAFRTFVVVGFLMLSGAINTSIIGSNGVLNRVSERWRAYLSFRKRHKKYGTSYRIINQIVGLQVITIIAAATSMCSARHMPSVLSGVSFQ